MTMRTFVLLACISLLVCICVMPANAALRSHRRARLRHALLGCEPKCVKSCCRPVCCEANTTTSPSSASTTKPTLTPAFTRGESAKLHGLLAQRFSGNTTLPPHRAPRHDRMNETAEAIAVLGAKAVAKAENLTVALEKHFAAVREHVKQRSEAAREMVKKTRREVAKLVAEARLAERVDSGEPHKAGANFVRGLLGSAGAAGSSGTESSSLIPASIDISKTESPYKGAPKSVAYLGKGYDMLTGCPHAVSLGGEGVDPGFRATVFAMVKDPTGDGCVGVPRTYCPQGVDVLPVNSCTHSSRARAISSMEEWSEDLADEITESGSTKVGISASSSGKVPLGGTVSGSASMSHSSAFSKSQAATEFRSRTINSGQTVLVAKSMCTEYKARIIMSPKPDVPPQAPFSAEFIEAVAALPELQAQAGVREHFNSKPLTTHEQEYIDFISAFGTHVVVLASFGAKRIVESYVSTSDFRSAEKQGVSSKYTEAGAWSVSVSLAYNKAKAKKECCNGSMVVVNAPSESSSKVMSGSLSVDVARDWKTSGAESKLAASYNELAEKFQDEREVVIGGSPRASWAAWSDTVHARPVPIAYSVMPISRAVRMLQEHLASTSEHTEHSVHSSIANRMEDAVAFYFSQPGTSFTWSKVSTTSAATTTLAGAELATSTELMAAQPSAVQSAFSVSLQIYISDTPASGWATIMCQGPEEYSEARSRFCLMISSAGTLKVTVGQALTPGVEPDGEVPSASVSGVPVNAWLHVAVVVDEDGVHTSGSEGETHHIVLLVETTGSGSDVYQVGKYDEEFTPNRAEQSVWAVPISSPARALVYFVDFRFAASRPPGLLVAVQEKMDEARVEGMHLRKLPAVSSGGGASAASHRSAFEAKTGDGEVYLIQRSTRTLLSPTARAQDYPINDNSFTLSLIVYAPEDKSEVFDSDDLFDSIISFGSGKLARVCLKRKGYRSGLTQYLRYYVKVKDTNYWFDEVNDAEHWRYKAAHIGIVYASSELRLYLNGELDSTHQVATADRLTVDSNYQLYVGAVGQPDVARPDGYIHALRFLNWAAQASELRADYDRFMQPWVAFLNSHSYTRDIRYFKTIIDYVMWDSSENFKIHITAGGDSIQYDENEEPDTLTQHDERSTDGVRWTDPFLFGTLNNYDVKMAIESDDVNDNDMDVYELQLYMSSPHPADSWYYSASCAPSDPVHVEDDDTLDNWSTICTGLDLS